VLAEQLLDACGQGASGGPNQPWLAPDGPLDLPLADGELGFDFNVAKQRKLTVGLGVVADRVPAANDLTTRMSRRRGVVLREGPSSNVNRIARCVVPPRIVRPLGKRMPVASGFGIGMTSATSGPGSACMGSTMGAGTGRIANGATAAETEPPPTIARAQQLSRTFHISKAIVRKRGPQKRETRSTWTGLQLQRGIASSTPCALRAIDD